MTFNKNNLNNILNQEEVFLLLSEEKLQDIAPEIKKMVGFEQNNPHHSYDLWGHTLHTILNTPKGELRVASLLHDIGKPEVATEKEGKTVFYGHAEKSAEIALPILLKLGYTEEEAEYICFFIRQHDVFITFKMGEFTSKSVAKKLRKVRKTAQEEGTYIPSKNDFVELLKLCRADTSAQAEVVIENGVQVSSKKEKLKKFDLIEQFLNEIKEEDILL